MAKKWKIAFFALLGINVLVILSLVGMYNYYFPESNIPEKQRELRQPATGSPTFSILMDKDKLTSVLNNELDKYSDKQENIDYRVRLDELASFQGFVTIFNRKIDFFLKFEPEVLPNGDLILREESFQFGLLELPSDKVLGFLKKRSSLPEEITIDPDKGTIHIAVSNLELKNGMRLMAKEFNLKKNKIIFDAYYPLD
ncbi:YpmS family protein [Pseudalkalibacillus caeni]|uniref:DUF2140 family protein n=1 Tax=Exobacillus caeni TaxID=2574798 RepID=A0A5R9F2Z5_9BACL|nr:YpmS family protein [Pseudalkalibacillus caeni]TLS38052.1 DUF2140 family protein [Pseudalkalibacillus caeni]